MKSFQKKSMLNRLYDENLWKLNERFFSRKKKQITQMFFHPNEIKFSTLLKNIFQPIKSSKPDFSFSLGWEEKWKRFFTAFEASACAFWMNLCIDFCFRCYKNSSVQAFYGMMVIFHEIFTVLISLLLASSSLLCMR
jgi:hypothetical protein